jgi:hypothetical protein
LRHDASRADARAGQARGADRSTTTDHGTAADHRGTAADRDGGARGRGTASRDPDRRA